MRLIKKIPSFSLTASSNKILSLDDFAGKILILYFYPKDNTPGCTQESKDFRDAIQEFQKLNAIVVGVSRDSVKSHEKFIENYCLPFDLLSDSEEQLCQMFDVIKMKNMYGKQVRGIERSTFLIDQAGVLRREWRKVKVEGHVAEVLVAAQQLVHG